MLSDAFEHNYGVCIFRNGAEGLDLSNDFLEQTVGGLRFTKGESKVTLEYNDSTVGANTVVSMPQDFDPAHLVHRHVNHKLKADFHAFRHSEQNGSGKKGECAGLQCD